ncbi:hypothetical protein VULLAG_LOCUS8295 [Vulpes lagopus]
MYPHTASSAYFAEEHKFGLTGDQGNEGASIFSLYPLGSSWPQRPRKLVAPLLPGHSTASVDDSMGIVGGCTGGGSGDVLPLKDGNICSGSNKNRPSLSTMLHSFHLSFFFVLRGGKKDIHDHTVGAL